MTINVYAKGDLNSKFKLTHWQVDTDDLDSAINAVKESGEAKGPVLAVIIGGGVPVQQIAPEQA